MRKLALILGLLVMGVPAFAQSVQQQVPQKATIAQSTQSAKKNKTIDPKNIIGVTYAENSVKNIEASINLKNYTVAKQISDSVSQWVSDAAEYHTDLFKTLKRVENADTQANIERDLAIKFATMRDKLLFLQAKILIHDGQTKEAVDKLVDVVKSQPDTELGFQSYKILQEIGFSYGVDTVPVKTEPIQPSTQ